jgi:hypothetical protein
MFVIHLRQLLCIDVNIITELSSLHNKKFVSSGNLQKIYLLFCNLSLPKAEKYDMIPATTPKRRHLPMDKNNRKDNPKDDNSQNKKPKGNIILALVIAVAVVLLFTGIYNFISDSKYTETTYNDFLAAMNAGNLAEV